MRRMEGRMGALPSIQSNLTSGEQAALSEVALLREATDS